VSGIALSGWGAISPAGWGVQALREVCEGQQPCPTTPLHHPRLPTPIQARRVPPPTDRPAFIAHPRLRRSSPISIHAAGAALEALGPRLPEIQQGLKKLGIVFSSMTGCVAYSQRFYDEVLKDPATASPIVFPETVFNAPASHLATYLNTNAISYTLIGDAGSFLQGMALAAEWLLDGRIDACLVVGAEELQWLVAGAQQLFDPQVIVSEGAGAVLLEREDDSNAEVQLDFVTQPVLYTERMPRAKAVSSVYQTIHARSQGGVLFDSLTGAPNVDASENECLCSWSGRRISVKTLCGESYGAGSAWQCVLAADYLSRRVHRTAAVGVAGCNQQAIGAGFSFLER